MQRLCTESSVVNSTVHLIPKSLPSGWNAGQDSVANTAALHRLFAVKRSYLRVICMLSPDLVIYIHLYFFLLLYITTSALYLLLYAYAEEDEHSHAIFRYFANFVLSSVRSVHFDAVSGTTYHYDRNDHLVWWFICTLGLPVVILIVMTGSNPGSATILRPAQFMRPTIPNLLVIVSTLLEGFQLSATTFQVLYDVSFYNSTASTWTWATPRTTWELVLSLPLPEALYELCIFTRSARTSQICTDKLCYNKHRYNESFCATNGLCSPDNQVVLGVACIHVDALVF